MGDYVAANNSNRQPTTFFVIFKQNYDWGYEGKEF